MSLIKNTILVGSTYGFNQFLWLMVAWSGVYGVIKIFSFDLIGWGSANPGYVIFWNFFNDFIPYLITGYAQNFRKEVDNTSISFFVLLIGYGVVGLLVAWRWKDNPHLAGLNYPLLTLMIFVARVLMIWNLSLKLKIQRLMEGLDV